MGLFKRSYREEEYGEQVIDHIKMANYLMFLSRGGGGGGVDVAAGFTAPSVTTTSAHKYSSSRVFECKTCGRQFPSFQALGGHRASHKRPRIVPMNGQTGSSTNGGLDGSTTSTSSTPPMKPKTHECAICGLEFGIGQALGGHMRRHRAATMDAATPLQQVAMQAGPLVKAAASSSKRVVCLDLNLTPLENDLEFRLGGKVIASMVG